MTCKICQTGDGHTYDMRLALTAKVLVVFPFSKIQRGVKCHVNSRHKCNLPTLTPGINDTSMANLRWLDLVVIALYFMAPRAIPHWAMVLPVYAIIIISSSITFITHPGAAYADN